VLGDNQFATNSPTSGVPERMAVPEVALALKPDFILHTGDLMDHGWDKDAYARFVDYYRRMLNAIPFFPTMGNHDAARGGIRNYRTYLRKQLRVRNTRVGGESFCQHLTLWFEDDKTPYPESFKDPSRPKFRPNVPTGVSFKTFYAFRFRNALFLSLEQGTRWWANTPRSWLEEHLKTARQTEGVDHVFAFMHHPMYSTTMQEGPSSGECIQPVRKLYEPLFRKYDVTMVFSGHAHLYDHFFVPDDDSPTRHDPPPKTYPHNGSGIHYIVTGGGGGPVNRGGWRKERSYQFFQKRICTYHVTQVKIDGKRVEVAIHLVKGGAGNVEREVFDTFSLGGQPLPSSQRK